MFGYCTKVLLKYNHSLVLLIAGSFAGVKVLKAATTALVVYNASNTTALGILTSTFQATKVIF